MQALYINTHAGDVDHIKIDIIERPIPNLGKDECLIKVFASGVNPSDALAAMGYFNHSNLPRIPGRDFSGLIVGGPHHLIGKKVWGTGGAAGIAFDGTQAQYIKLSQKEIAECPHNLELTLAGAQPLPYVTAYYSLVQRAHLHENESVLVVGALGQVGKAAMSICKWKKCHPIALVRGKNAIAEAKALGWNAIDSDESDLEEKILSANRDFPVNVILNSVGNLYWQDFMQVLSEFGRIVIIGARENAREAMTNLFNLYRANQDIIGINTVSFNFAENAKLLNALKVGFEENQLTPLALEQSMIFPPEQATAAYQTVIKGSLGQRVVIQFK